MSAALRTSVHAVAYTGMWAGLWLLAPLAGHAEAWQTAQAPVTATEPAHAITPPRAPDDLQALLAQPPITGVAPGARAWRSDGGALAFAWNAAGGPVRELWLHRPGEPRPQQLTQLASIQGVGAGIRELAWLDQQRVAIIAAGKLWVFDLERAELSVLDEQVAQPRNLSVSPDGRWLAFTSGGPATRYQHAFMGDGSLWLRPAAADARHPSQRLYGEAEPRVAVEQLQWSRDGQRIAFVEADNRPVAEREIHYHVEGQLAVDRVVRPFPGEPVIRRRLGVLTLAAARSDVTHAGTASSVHNAGSSAVSAGAGSIPEHTPVQTLQWLLREDEEQPLWQFGLSGDGQRLFSLSSDALAEQLQLDVYSLADGTRTRFYSYHDAGNVVPGWDAAWAPDDQGLILLSDHEGAYRLYYLAEPGAEPQPLTTAQAPSEQTHPRALQQQARPRALQEQAHPRALQEQASWEIFEFTVDPTRGQIYAIANREHPAQRQLYRIPLQHGQPVASRTASDDDSATHSAAGSHGHMELLTPIAGHWEPSFAADFSRVALTFSSDTQPPDLYTLDLQGDQAARSGAASAQAIARLTHSPAPAFDSYRWADARYLSYPSERDGQPVLGRLLVPPGFEPQGCYPLIVGSIYSNTVVNQWSWDARPNWALDQYLVSQGYLVLKVNVRGSLGQGRRFSGGLLHDYGGIDTDDIETVVRGLIADGTVDQKRVGIWGNSYGGLMTLMSLFRKPGLYAAGIAGAPATNVWHAYPSQMWVMGPPEGEDYPARYERQSALFHSEGLSDPLLIIHGTADPIVLYSDTLALSERLIAQNKAFELLTLPGAGHGWMAENPTQTRFVYSRMLDFFARHVPAAPTAASCAVQSDGN